MAGANGAGKSSLTQWAASELLAPDTIIVDPDAIARDQQLERIGAGRAATQIVSSAIARGADLLIETTFAGNNARRLMRTAARKGYDVRLLYIGTDDVAVNIRRIALRVESGGHDVPPSDVERRYARSLANLPDGIRLAAEVGIFDNSIDDVAPTLVAYGAAEDLQQLVQFPSWLSRALQSARDTMR